MDGMNEVLGEWVGGSSEWRKEVVFGDTWIEMWENWDAFRGTVFNRGRRRRGKKVIWWGW